MPRMLLLFLLLTAVLVNAQPVSEIYTTYFDSISQGDFTLFIENPKIAITKSGTG